MQKTMTQQVLEFHQTYRCPYYSKPQQLHHVKPERIDLRISLMQEELKETIDALKNSGLADIADGLCDLLYVVIGTAWEVGLGSVLEEMFAEVHRSNMSKLGLDNEPIFREDGKVMKGPNFTKPDLVRIISNKIREHEQQFSQPGALDGSEKIDKIETLS